MRNRSSGGGGRVMAMASYGLEVERAPVCKGYVPGQTRPTLPSRKVRPSGKVGKTRISIRENPH